MSKACGENGCLRVSGHPGSHVAPGDDTDEDAVESASIWARALDSLGRPDTPEDHERFFNERKTG